MDYSYLACDHHIYMILGVGMVANHNETFDMLIIGLGGGALSMYLHTCFKQVRNDYLFFKMKLQGTKFNTFLQ